MVKDKDEFKKDIIEFRNRIKRFREKVLDELLEGEDIVGDEDILDLTKQEYDELEKFIDKFHDRFFINVYKSQEVVQFELEDFASDLKKIHKEIKAKRESLEGENALETTKNVVEFIEKKFKKMMKKMKKQVSWDSELDLFKDLK